LEIQRRELTVPERIDYIRAIKCMQSKPPISQKHFSVVKSRYDDFVALHANSTGGGIKLDGSKGWSDMVANPSGMANQMRYGIHGTGTFLPWHRYALSLWENALGDECGWKFGIAYWDWHRDTPEAGSEWLQSPVFDPVSGYGGNGKRVNVSMTPPGMNSTAFAALAKIIPGLDAPMTMGGLGGGCVLDGPFQNQTLSIGPMGQMTANNTRCLTRNINPLQAQTSANSKSMRKVLSAKNMVEFRQWAESGSRDWSLSMKGISVDSYGSMHDIGHGGVGGEVSWISSSAMFVLTDNHRCLISSIRSTIPYFFFIMLELTGFGLCGRTKIPNE
jgi:tyrosinase